MENDERQSAIEALYRSTEQEFNERWGWQNIAMSVHEATGETFFQIMDRSVYEVLSLAIYLREKVEVLEQKYKKIK